MITVLLLVFLGFALGSCFRVFVLVPVGAGLIASAMLVSGAGVDLGLEMPSTLMAYVVALDLGYVIGSLWPHSKGKHLGIEHRRTFTTSASRRSLPF